MDLVGLKQGTDVITSIFKKDLEVMKGRGNYHVELWQ